MPQALEVVWTAMDDEYFEPKKKLTLLEKFDKVLGLDIKKMKKIKLVINSEVRKLIQERENARKAKDWQKADKIRTMIKQKGFRIEDGPSGPELSVE